ELAAARQQFRAAYRKQLLAAQLHRIEAGPVAVAVAHGEVHFLSREIDVMQRRGDAQVDLGMRLDEIAEPVHQPFGGQVRQGAHREYAGILTLQKPLGAHRDAVERITHHGEIVAARLGNDDALAFAIEQLDAESGFKRLDLLAYRALRDEELLR